MITHDIFIAMQHAALAAGNCIMDFYQHGCIVEHKQDNSPVTQADKQAELIILNILSQIAPHIPIIAEESMTTGKCPANIGQMFFLVDPLDGTREFLKRNGEFTVNIALINQGVPVLGVVYQPTNKNLYFGSLEGAFHTIITPDMNYSHLQKIQGRQMPVNPIALLSRSHCSSQTQQWLTNHNLDAQKIEMGSSLKFCYLAQGKADIYPRFEACMQWDTAAGDAILRAAGGIVVGLNQKPIIYGKKASDGCLAFSQDFFLAFGEKSNSLKPEWRQK